MTVDFRKGGRKHKHSNIHGNKVNIVDTNKYLGTVCDSKLKFEAATKYSQEVNREFIFKDAELF